MLEPGCPSRFIVRLCGERAIQLLHSDAPCRVSAVFERSFYLEAGGVMACLGNPAIGLGPLNGVIDVPAGMDWRASGLRLDAACRRGPGTIYLGNIFGLSLTQTRTWRPAAAPSWPDPTRISRALDRFFGASTQFFPVEGLAPLLKQDNLAWTATPILTAAQGSVIDARRWLGAVFGRTHGKYRHGMEWVRGLVGLGPGLTPSGDDFLGGIMIALHALGEPAAARRLADQTVSVATSLGNAISAAHLAAAAEGQGHAAIHNAVNELLRGGCKTAGAHLDAVGRIGHASGWDTLAGVMTAVQVWLAAQGVRRRAA
jgi:hypothetical protein